MIALTACDEQPLVDCTRLDMAAVERCWDRRRGDGEASAVVACLPFSQRLSTEGFWVVGFEKNDFFEGKNRPPDKVLWSGSTGAALILNEGVFNVPERTQAFEVSVVGRRALCPMGATHAYPIAVEKLEVRRRVG